MPYPSAIRWNGLHNFMLAAVLLLLLPLAGFMLWGFRFFTDVTVFTAGSLLNLLPIVLAYGCCLAGARTIAKIYPEINQSVVRVTLWFFLYMLVNVSILSVFLFIYHQLQVFGYNFNKVTATWTGVFMGASALVGAGVTELLFTFTQWRVNQDELQELEHRQLQNELDLVKQQVNPHFLFNCLNSLSVLISESPEVAEKFVDEMSQVYRYLLSMTTPESEHRLVTLEAELRFIRSYVYLLKTRFESGIQVDCDINEIYLSGQLAPLTLQTLIDNAVRHNIVSPDTPLFIYIKTTATGQLEVFNNLQKRVIATSFGNAGLASLVSRYKLLFNQAGTIQVKEETGYFRVTLPLIYV